jgi:hypothetical protein
MAINQIKSNHLEHWSEGIESGEGGGGNIKRERGIVTARTRRHSKGVINYCIPKILN